MKLSATFLSDIRADQGTSFWLWFAVKSTLGIGQMVGAIVGVILFVHGGLSSATMGVVLGVAVLTTLSLLLFRILGWKPVKR